MKQTNYYQGECMMSFEQFFESKELRKYLTARGVCKDCDAIHDALNANDIDALKNNSDAYTHALRAYECYCEGIDPADSTTDFAMTEHERLVHEAHARLHMLGCIDSVVSDFKKSGKLYYSERTPLGGILYWVDNNPTWVKLIHDFEKEYDAVVYHATHEYTEFGELLDLFFVSRYAADWEFERKALTDLKHGVAYIPAYTVNLTDPDGSEMGSIGIIRKSGGIIRAY